MARPNAAIPIDAPKLPPVTARFAAVAFKEPPDKDGNYKFFHSGQVFVLDKGGRLRAAFFDASLDNMATVTALLIGEKG